ncbi:MAG: PilZ domain-containing protein [Nitrospirota bacterium]
MELKSGENKLSGKRGYFRVDDVLPLIAKKVTYDPSCRKSRVFSGYNIEITDTEVPDETINLGLWKMLVEINNKLEMILERLQLESEGFTKAENKQVNISESGIKFIMNEKAETGDVLEIKILLSSSPSLGILTYGNVVRANSIGDGKYEVALHFSDMNDEVREKIIQHILKRQRGIMRK